MAKTKKKSLQEYIFFFMAICTVVFGILTVSIVSTKQNNPSAKAAGKETFGISGHLLGLNTADLNKTLDDYKALGVQWVRDDFQWPQIQPNNQNTYDWTGHDAVVAAANKRGIKVLGIIDYVPQWELPSGCNDMYRCPPRNNMDYATFAAAVATHYAALGVHTWELWNEPNNGAFTPAAYATLVKIAYPAIKQADSTAFVLAGATAPTQTAGSTYSATDFLTAIYKNGDKGYFDAISHHPYCFGSESSTYTCPKDSANWDGWTEMQDTNPNLRSIMIANGDQDKQIWGTEFGAPTGGGTQDYALPVTEAQEAQMVTDAYELWNTYNWTGPLFWYTYQDSCATTTSIECYFGLVRTDYSQKPAYTAYKNAAQNAIQITTTIKPSPSITSALTGIISPTINQQQSGVYFVLCPHGIGTCGDNSNPVSPGNLSPKHQTRNITATLYNMANQLVLTEKGTTSYNTQSLSFEGNMYFPTIPTGQYLLSVKMDGFLNTSIGIVSLTQGKVTGLTSLPMTTGDINNDNQIDIQDYNALISCYGTKQASSACITPPTAQTYGSDINDDGVVGAIDYNLFLRELSVQRGN